MKTIIILSAIFIVSSCVTSSKKTIFINSKDELILKVCSNTTESELKEIANTLAVERNISLDFSKTKFSTNGKIDDLDIEIQEKNGFRCHLLAELFKTDEYHGFIRDYRPNTPNNIRCGFLEEF